MLKIKEEKYLINIIYDKIIALKNIILFFILSNIIISFLFLKIFLFDYNYFNFIINNKKNILLYKI